VAFHRVATNGAQREALSECELQTAIPGELVAVWARGIRKTNPSPGPWGRMVEVPDGRCVIDGVDVTRPWRSMTLRRLVALVRPGGLSVHRLTGRNLRYTAIQTPDLERWNRWARGSAPEGDIRGFPGRLSDTL